MINARIVWTSGLCLLLAAVAGVYALFGMRAGSVPGRSAVSELVSALNERTPELTLGTPLPADVANVVQPATNHAAGGGPASNDANSPTATSQFESYIASLANEPDSLYLSDEERTYLWKTEQCAFELERHVLSVLAQALRDDDANAWRAMLHTEFEGTIPSSLETAASRPFVHVRKWSANSGKSSSVDRDKFLRFLFELREKFSSLQTVKFGLPRLSPATRGNVDGPWVGRIRLDMRGTLPKGELAEVIIDSDMELARLSIDARDDRNWITRLDCSRFTWSRGPRALLVDVAEQRGLQPERFHDNWKSDVQARKVITGGIYLADYNQDGWLDVLVTDLRGNVLFRGTPTGRFEDVTREAGLADFGPGGVAAFADLDNDGDVDLVAAGESRLAFYDNMGDGRFRLVRSTRPPRSVVSIAIADFDGDGMVDLFLPGDAPIPFSQRGPNVSLPSYIDDRTGRDNVLFRNRGRWRFQNVTQSANLAGDGGSDFTALWFDADGNGLPDVVTVNELGANLLGLNNGDGTFDVRHIEGSHAPSFSMGGSTGDFDNDGLIDVYFSNMYSKAGSRVIGNLTASLFPPGHYASIQAWVSGNSLFRNEGDARFRDIAVESSVHDVGFAYGSSFVDLDNDGWLDIYALAGFHSVSRSQPDG